ncbi:MAG TPA: DUF87 domain-containing protein, partial [Anaerolineae bacterium]|nr:DUF87 domain-containing protein [Anaerolineae bacterium]
MAKLANPFIPYLNRYTTTSPDHEAAFDEFITQAPPPSGEPLRLETRTEAFLHDLFHRKCPPSVILTGNAGDGKTHLCRRIVKAFTGQPVTDWADRLDRPIEPDKADIGPSVVRFKIRLRPGEKLSHLQAIAADLQRELALTAAPLVDNVLGTRFVGIDLPRPQPETLLLTEALVELPSAEVGHLPFLVGKTPSGETVKADLSTLPHLLVAGSTGSGKTIFLYTLITSLLHQFGPDALSLLLVDPKQTDFVYFEGLPHLPDGQVIIEAEEAIAWL